MLQLPMRLSIGVARLQSRQCVRLDSGFSPAFCCSSGQAVSRQPSLSARVQTQTSRLQAIHTSTSRFFGLPSLSSLLSSNSSNSNNNNGGHQRILTATRTLPYEPSPLFKVISSVDAYAKFLPFLTESTVTARDPVTGYPTRAFLTIGYGPISETFTSRVDCLPQSWVVEARSGPQYETFEGEVNQSAGNDAGVGAAATATARSVVGGSMTGQTHSVFEFLNTRWQLVPIQVQSPGRAPLTEVRLEIQFEFRSRLHAAMMGTVESQMAGLMIEAFERRIHELEGQRR